MLFKCSGKYIEIYFSFKITFCVYLLMQCCIPLCVAATLLHFD